MNMLYKSSTYVHYVFFFITGTYSSDAENLSKNIYFILKVALVLTDLLHVFVMFPGHLPTLTRKEAFHKSAEQALKVRYNINQLDVYLYLTVKFGINPSSHTQCYHFGLCFYAWFQFAEV